uniref:Restriction endonuclease n=1 Tax=Candidatus Kentrum sp. MB TaxID=2138164 RepID=A0A451B838_9GAMM|nr:MAG: hypothetical protein BECKMB1821G_GA0114241_10059 [Candidatus Kentron sp. MB]VFK27861.1 MAG: hypothetical protein BECKMB1821I_GA0114274_10059 [Candidatus Kentron sp. MB]VFK74444.1 MAG: hypothetical protein BECKMB1821H_GA0114242_10059 [Candidatus Kentron sp. MB]
MSPIELLLQVISDHTQKSKWVGSPLEAFRYVENTNRGDIGEDFIRRYLKYSGIAVLDHKSRTDPSDMEINGRKFEIKTASEDKGGNFQFNHIRHDIPHDYLLCLGIRPSQIMFNAWRKGEVAEGKAGTLVRMARGQSVTFKLTKRPETMLLISDLPEWIRKNVMVNQ